MLRVDQHVDHVGRLASQAADVWSRRGVTPVDEPSISLRPEGGLTHMALLEIRDLTVDYLPRGRRVRAVDEVSLDIESGEYFGIVGESRTPSTVMSAR